MLLQRSAGEAGHTVRVAGDSRHLRAQRYRADDRQGGGSERIRCVAHRIAGRHGDAAFR